MKASSQMTVKLTPDLKKEKLMISHSISSRTLILLVNNQKLKDNLKKWNSTDVCQVFHRLKFLKLVMNGIVLNAKTINWPKNNWTFTERQRFWFCTWRDSSKREPSRRKRTNPWFIFLKHLTFHHMSLTRSQSRPTKKKSRSQFTSSQKQRTYRWLWRVQLQLQLTNFMRSATISEGWEADITQLMLKTKGNGTSSTTVEWEARERKRSSVQAHTFCFTRESNELRGMGWNLDFDSNMICILFDLYLFNYLQYWISMYEYHQ